MNVSSPKTASIQSTQKPTTLQKNEQSSEQAQRQEASAKPSQPSQAQPVINTQGQTTGRLLNVTA
jgi:hypothetical protein